jgi:mRNA interferase RelE/StbE
MCFGLCELPPLAPNALRLPDISAMFYALCCLGSANFFVDDTQSWMCLLTNGLNSGYNMARMKYEILFAQEAVQDFKRLSARDRSIVKEAIEKHLKHEPQRISKSRIKKLRGMSRPQYRLRVGEIRVFYDIVEQRVEVLAIVPKSKAATWLEELREEK